MGNTNHRAVNVTTVTTVMIGAGAPRSTKLATRRMRSASDS
jgi:hypothetical protein